MNSLFIRKDDKVKVLSGKDKGKTGKILEVYPKKETAVVEGVMVVTKHMKPRNRMQPGGITHKESPVRVCKLQLVCPKCGEPTRVAHTISADGTKSRSCKKCKELI